MRPTLPDNHAPLRSDDAVWAAGLEIGAVSVKWVLHSSRGDCETRVVRHEGNPMETLDDILDKATPSGLKAIVLTGRTVHAPLNCHYRPEAECIEKSLAHSNLKPDILLSLGGETFTLYTLKDGRIKNTLSTSKCAAGTGEFIVQQFQRMGFSLAEGMEASYRGNPVDLATRCSVYCKSDATHKLNKGECSKQDIARTLIRNLASKVRTMIEQARWPSDNILVAGGISNNTVFVEELGALFPDAQVLTLDQSPCLEAFGAALFASELSDTECLEPPALSLPGLIQTESLPPLAQAEELLDYRVDRREKPVLYPDEPHVLAIDAGSTTTKAVLYNIPRECVGAEVYLRTLGNPIEAARNCLTHLMEQIGNTDIPVVQAAATGSAREMVSVFLDNSLSFNEILAHARAAARETDTVDTVFEIGGQDSKFIAFLNGVPVDYAMNEGCSAGTGSFLEESISIDIGVPYTEISRWALESHKPVLFGERCAAFINTDVRSALQQGAPKQDVIAGLVYAISDNYISRIVGTRPLGETLVFQGGVALNKAVALAMAARTGRKIMVPPYPEMMGCIGAAQMTLDRLGDGRAPHRHMKLKDILDHRVSVGSTFRCKSCSNRCDIQNIRIAENTYPFGGLCSKFDNARHGKEASNARDFVAVRNSLMFEEFAPKEPPQSRGIIGLPMALTSYELFPFYTSLIEALGFTVIVSGETKTTDTDTNAPICYPGEIAHGAVRDLIDRGADYIFLPYLIAFAPDPSFARAYACPNTAQLPDLIRATFPKAAARILSPLINLSEPMTQTTRKEIKALGKGLGLKASVCGKAFDRAMEQYARYVKRHQRLGYSMLSQIKNEPAVILAGRPYTICSPEVNLALPRKVISRGYHAVPADLLPMAHENTYPGNVWRFTAQAMNGLAYAKRHARMGFCLLSCFSCIPDASMLHLMRRELAGQAFCYLEIDSHTAHAGFETRIGAYLDILDEKRQRETHITEKELNYA